MAGVRATILGEDQRQISFATRVLKLLKYKDCELFRETVPDGGGSGEQWVRRHYPRQVALNRQKRSYQQCTLLVTIDGDNRSVRFRKEQLDEALRKSSMPPRGADEPIAIWVPCRCRRFLMPSRNSRGFCDVWRVGLDCAESEVTKAPLLPRWRVRCHRPGQQQRSSIPATIDGDRGKRG